MSLDILRPLALCPGYRGVENWLRLSLRLLFDMLLDYGVALELLLEYVFYVEGSPILYFLLYVPKSELLSPL